MALEIPMDEAIQELTGFEMIEMKKVLKVNTLADADAMEMMYATVYVYEKRENDKAKYGDSLRMTMREVQGYFAEASVHPDDEVGKE